MKYTFLCSVLMLLNSIGMAFGTTLTAAIGDYPPYTSKASSDARLAEEIVKAAYLASGYTVELRRVPWKRALIEAKTGRVDISFGWFKTSEHEQDFYFSLPIYPVKEVFLYHKDSLFEWETLADLTSYRIGATLGYTHIQILQQAGIPIDIAPSDELALHKLYKHRIDATPMDITVALYLLSKLPDSYRKALTYDETPLLVNHQHVIANKSRGSQSQKWIELFNQGLTVIRKNGKMESWNVFCLVTRR